MLAATLVVAALVQGLVGLGLGLVAAPVVALLEPRLMPELMLWLGMLMPVVTLAREHHDIDWRGIAWALPTRVVGTVAGVWLVATVSDAALGALVGVVVLLAVLLSLRTVDLEVTRPRLAAAGLVSGISGTATSIGGPPIALLYQHRPAAQIRSTLAVFFAVGAGLSLVGLALAGEMEPGTALLALALAPALVVGFVLSRVLDRRLPQHHVRVGVLAVCAASAVAALVRSLGAS